MISAIFSDITSAVTGMLGALTQGIESAVGLIVDTSGSTPSITVFGSLCLCVVGVGVCYWAFRLVRNLIHLRG